MNKRPVCPNCGQSMDCNIFRTMHSDLWKAWYECDCGYATPIYLSPIADNARIFAQKLVTVRVLRR